MASCFHHLKYADGQRLLCDCVCVHMFLCEHVCVHTHQSQKSMCGPQLLIILCSEPVSLTLDLSDSSRLATQQVLEDLHVLVCPCDELVGHIATNGYFFLNLDSGRIKACLHACIPSTLSTEPFPQLKQCFFKH